MLKRHLCAWTLCLIFVWPIATPAAEPPAIVMRLQSIENLVKDAVYSGTLIGQEEPAKQLEGFYQSLAGTSGIYGIDTKRPLGVYATISADLVGSKGIVLLPIADEKALLDQLENFNIKATKDNDGVYAIRADRIPAPIFFRFANKYAYVTALDRANLEPSKLLDPQVVFPAKETGLVSALVRIDQIPNDLKQMFLSQLQLRLTEEQDKKMPNENEQGRAIRVETIKLIGEQITSVVKDGSDLSFRYNLNPTADQIGLELSLSGKPGSKLAESIAGLAQSKSIFADVGTKDLAFKSIVHFAFPQQFSKLFVAAVDDGVKKDLAKEKDEHKRKVAEQLMNAIRPTLQSGELDAGVQLFGPGSDNHYTMLVGIKLKDGAGVDRSIREVIKEIPEKERRFLKMDIEKVGSASIHEFDAQENYDKAARKLFGSNPVFVAVHPEGVWLTVGPSGLPTIRSALAAKPNIAPIFALDAAWSHALPLFNQNAKLSEQQLKEVAAKALKKAGADKMSMTIEGGKALAVRVRIDSSWARFFAEANKLEKAK